MEIQVINKSENQLPNYATIGSSGMDLRSNIPTFTLNPLERKLVPTGIFLSIPIGFEGQVRPRSGLAIKRGLTCLNAPGTIDSDYRGDVGVILVNLSTEPQTVEHGERIAQIVFCQVEQAEFVEVDTLSDTVRGAGGFGHSGTK